MQQSKPNELPEFNEILREAVKSVEDDLKIEDQGWILLGGATINWEVLTDAERKAAVTKSRLYAVKDPLAKQSIRLWTDYTFGTGMSSRAKDKGAAKILDAFWENPLNKNVLSARGQRKCSDKVLIDGEIFFAIFLGPKGEATIRAIDPFEITEIIVNEDDKEDVHYYRREWYTPYKQMRKEWYRSDTNLKDVPTKDSGGVEIRATEDAIIYHFAYNSISQRGNPLLLPVLDWIKLYRRFLASRAAVMLALARFAWKNKIKGGEAAVNQVKAQYDESDPDAGSMAFENMGADLQPIKTDSGAKNANQDGRMLKLQIAAGTGWPEQYFGDISIGNLATAKTVELPVMKMIQSYQSIWSDTYDDIDKLILDAAGISPEKREIDRDFPAITPEDAGMVAESLAALIPIFPSFANSTDVMQQALMAIGITNTNDALEAIQKAEEELAKKAEQEEPDEEEDDDEPGSEEEKTAAFFNSDPGVRLAKILKLFQEAIINGQRSNGHVPVS